MSDQNSKTSKRVLNEHALNNISKTLIFGYGNPDREDDGVSWHILKGIAENFDIEFPDSCGEELIHNHAFLHFMFNLQLMPEMAYEMMNYKRICFVDAHTGALQKDLNIQILDRKFQNSPLTHHMTPQTVLSILDTAFNHKPEAILVSVRGYQFGFSNSLSKKTEILSEQAVKEISSWITD
ncbi:MAG TPA: hypothetical protein VK856_11430 [Anaerolineaceae bacterium]|nr:hypothetical protein [Anaerolineaceae bacterium]